MNRTALLSAQADEQNLDQLVGYISELTNRAGAVSSQAQGLSKAIVGLISMLDEHSLRSRKPEPHMSEFLGIAGVFFRFLQDSVEMLSATVRHGLVAPFSTHEGVAADLKKDLKEFRRVWDLYESSSQKVQQIRQAKGAVNMTRLLEAENERNIHQIVVEDRGAAISSTLRAFSDDVQTKSVAGLHKTMAGFRDFFTEGLLTVDRGEPQLLRYAELFQQRRAAREAAAAAAVAAEEPSSSSPPPPGITPMESPTESGPSMGVEAPFGADKSSGSVPTSSAIPIRMGANRSGTHSQPHPVATSPTSLTSAPAEFEDEGDFLSIFGGGSSDDFGISSLGRRGTPGSAPPAASSGGGGSARTVRRGKGGWMTAQPASSWSGGEDSADEMEPTDALFFDVEREEGRRGAKRCVLEVSAKGQTIVVHVPKQPRATKLVSALKTVAVPHGASKKVWLYWKSEMPGNYSSLRGKGGLGKILGQDGGLLAKATSAAEAVQEPDRYVFRTRAERDLFSQSVARVLSTENRHAILVYPDREELQLYVVTWNMGSAAPDAQLAPLFAGMPAGCEVVAIGTQESDYPARAGYSSSEQDLATSLQQTLGEQYVKAASVVLVAMRLFVFVRREKYYRISSVRTCSLATGLGNVYGNKGAVGVFLMLNQTRIALIGSHLAARTERVLNRNRDYENICAKLALNERHGARPSFGASAMKDAIHAADATIWLGDLNYRVELPREEILEHLRAGHLDPLLERDQLRREKERGNCFAPFAEAPLTFAPTYRWNRGSQTYSDEKMREPSYCDRILSMSPLPGLVRQHSYASVPELTSSDHRPVTALFSISTEGFPPPSLPTAPTLVLAFQAVFLELSMVSSGDEDSNSCSTSTSGIPSSSSSSSILPYPSSTTPPAHTSTSTPSIPSGPTGNGSKDSMTKDMNGSSSTSSLSTTTNGGGVSSPSVNGGAPSIGGSSLGLPSVLMNPTTGMAGESFANVTSSSGTDEGGVQATKGLPSPCVSFHGDFLDDSSLANASTVMAKCCKASWTRDQLPVLQTLSSDPSWLAERVLYVAVRDKGNANDALAMGYIPLAVSDHVRERMANIALPPPLARDARLVPFSITLYARGLPAGTLSGSMEISWSTAMPAQSIPSAALSGSEMSLGSTSSQPLLNEGGGHVLSGSGAFLEVSKPVGPMLSHSVSSAPAPSMTSTSPLAMRHHTLLDAGTNASAGVQPLVQGSGGPSLGPGGSAAPAAVAEEVYVAKQGYLTKMGGSRKTWRDRWFTVSSRGVVSYYSQQSAKQPIFSFPVVGCVVAEDVYPGRKNVFRIETPARVFMICAESPAVAASWVAALHSVGAVKPHS